MADNTTLDSGSGGDVIATDDISGVKYPRSKIVIGADGTNDGDVSSANPLPVTHAALTELAAAIDTEVQVDVVSSALPSGAATSAKQDTVIGHLDGVEGLLTTIDGDTGSLAGCVGGTELQVDVVSSALPSGAATAAKQPALGTAGTPSTDVLTIQGHGSGTAVKVDGSAVTQPISHSALTELAAAIDTEVQVDIVSSALPTGASTLSEQQTQTTHQSNAATSLGVMDDWDNAASDGASVSGDVAHDGVDAGEPVKIGAKAIAYGSNPTAVAAADRTDLYANRHGVLMVLGGVPGVITKEWTFTDSDGAQTDAALVTVSAGTKIAVTNIAAICDNANTGDVAVRVGFAAASLSAAATTGIAGIVMSHPGIAAGSGYNRGDGSGVLGVGADGEDLRVTCEDPAGGSIRIVASYFEIAS